MASIINTHKQPSYPQKGQNHSENTFSYFLSGNIKFCQHPKSFQYPLKQI
uniref:Uncharacterized protein n=1 Tax=Anguilla anguilla TaxID=7936 RepID=A0A0E9THN7_ANGAN